MKNSMYFRIFIATALIVLFSFSLLGGLSTVISYRRAMTEKRTMMVATLQETARYVTTQHLHHAVELGDLDISVWLTMISRVTGFDLFVTNADGVIESRSVRLLSNLGKRIPETYLQTVETGDIAVVMSNLGQLYPERKHVAGVPLTMNIGGDTRIFGHLFVISDVSVLRQEWNNFYSIFLFSALSVMVFAFTIAYVAMKQQAKPLNEIVNAARRFARGEFGTRVKERGRQDEIGQLTEAFNAMAETLDSSEQLRRDFIANLSHELKTPMTVIAGFAEGLLDGTIPREDELRYLNIISLETRRLSRLVKSMLELSKLQSTEAKTLFEGSFDISEVVRLALLSLDGKIEEKELGVEAELSDEAVMTRGDADSIIQVVYNLIDNAIKFSNRGGVICLELWCRDGKAYVSVTSRGETIPPDELPLIFDRFHKTDRSRSANRDGVGLGLFIVKKILDNHNEDIFVTSSGGVTRFIFSLTIV